MSVIDLGTIVGTRIGISYKSLNNNRRDHGNTADEIAGEIRRETKVGPCVGAGVCVVGGLIDVHIVAAKRQFQESAAGKRV